MLSDVIRSAWNRFRELYKTRRAVRWPVDAVVLVLVVALIGVWQTRGHARGVPLPDLTLASLDGRQVSLSSLAGKPTLVAFWAPWCSVCRSTSDNVARVARLGGARVQVVSVALAYDGRASVEKYVRDNAVDYPVLLGDDDLGQKLGVTSFPTFYVLGADGRIAGSAVGYTTTLGLLWRLLTA